MAHSVTLALLAALCVACTLLAPLCVHAYIDGYEVVDGSWQATPSGFTATLALMAGSGGPYGGDVANLALTVNMTNEDTLHVLLADADAARWQVPDVVELADQATYSAGTLNYAFSHTASPFGFAVTRLEDGVVIFNTTSPGADGGVAFDGLVYEQQYLAFSTQLPADAEPNLYGLGERVHAFRLDPEDTTYTIFNKDQGTPEDVNLYGAHPVYMELRDGAAHGFFLLNSNAMDVSIATGTLTFRTIGGVLDMYVFVGSTPVDVIQQYTAVVGRPVMPAHWELGFHQCRYGYPNLTAVEDVVAAYADNNLPLDTIWSDIDYMSAYYDFTTDETLYPAADMKAFAQRLADAQQQYVLIFDVGIPLDDDDAAYEEGVAAGVFTLDADGEAPIIGSVWPGYAVFPDFHAPNAAQWWTDQYARFHDEVPYAGIWIDMNEPSSFCSGSCDPADGPAPGPGRVSAAAADRPTPALYTSTSTYTVDIENPPYLPGGVSLDDKTLAMSAVQTPSLMYDTHNLYGYSEAKATRAAATQVFNARTLVLTRSTFAGVGKYAGHWLGDNNSQWSDLYYSIPGMLSFQLYGVPLVGADICGFGGDTTVELCARWMQLGAFYPFARNHNSLGTLSQEPYALGDTVLAASQRALMTRYTLLSYYYTLFFGAHTQGTPVMSAMLFEWPTDAATTEQDRQFLVGTALLVCPVLDEGATSVSCYLPAGQSEHAERWYWFYSGDEQGAGQVGQYSDYACDLDADDDTPVFVRGGAVVPLQTDITATTTSAATRASPYTLLVALDADDSASGRLYIDDGSSLFAIERREYTLVQVSVADGTLTATPTVAGYDSDAAAATIDDVTVYGVSGAVSSVQLNGGSWTGFSYDASAGVLSITGLGQAAYRTFTVSWQ